MPRIAHIFTDFAIPLGLFAVQLLSTTQADDVLSQFETHTFTNDAGEQLPYRLLKPLNYSNETKYPLVVFLHGSGERGNDNRLQLKHAAGDIASQQNQRANACFVLAPQCPKGQRWVDVDWSGDEHEMADEPTGPQRLVMKIVDQLENDFSIDKNRIYITGLSMGGFGVWDAIQRWPERFAAAVPVCGGGDVRQAKAIAKIPIWVFHGAKDNVVQPGRSRKMIDAIRAAGGKPTYTEYSEAGHDSWSVTYRNAQLYKWLFAQTK